MLQDMQRHTEQMCVTLQRIEGIQNQLKDEERLRDITKDMLQNTADSRKNILECHLHHCLRRLIKI